MSEPTERPPASLTPSQERLGAAVVACLTLGLAPWFPPHIVGKLEWVRGGAVGMEPLDWFDLVMHGAPWVWLVVELGLWALRPRG